MATAVITHAIRSGAPLYNDGLHSECANIYTAATSTLLTDNALAAQLNANAAHLLRDALLRKSSVDATALAWQLRHGFDVQLGTTPSPHHPAVQHHRVLGSPLCSPFPAGLEVCAFGTGCFWGSEKSFWRLPGVYTTAVGYCGGQEGSSEPTYEEVCRGSTGHNEVTLVVWDPQTISFADLLCQFWRCHDPTQGNRQGSDRGTQYRSGIYCTTQIQGVAARASLEAFDPVLHQHGFPSITTEVRIGVPFHYAEDYHQQYLARAGARQYCSAEPTGIVLPAFETWMFAGLGEAEASSKCAPKLPQIFWATYDGSISAPNEAVEFSLEALAAATTKVEIAAKAHAALVTAAERDSDVIITFCGGCGFAKRAEKLADTLRQAASAEVGLVKDIGITGNFDVKIRSQNGSFRTIHSKKAGDGFVDSDTLIQQIIVAAEAAASRQAVLALPSGAKPSISKLARRVDGSKEESNKAYRARLSSAQYAVLRQKRTEPRHGVKRENGGFDDVFDDGKYYCGACNALLYTSDMKYDCGCGWPGFWTNVDGAVRSTPDADGRRNELVCNACNSHLGHLFIGEKHGYVTDERHCVNSCSLAFAAEGSDVARACSYQGNIC